MPSYTIGTHKRGRNDFYDDLPAMKIADFNVLSSPVSDTILYVSCPGNRCTSTVSDEENAQC